MSVLSLGARVTRTLSDERNSAKQSEAVKKVGCLSCTAASSDF